MVKSYNGSCKFFILHSSFFIYFPYLCSINVLTMSKEQPNIIEYLVCVIGAFARQFSLTNAKAYQYLRQYKGLDFLTKHSGVEHTQSIEDAVEDITIICNRHGGALAL